MDKIGEIYFIYEQKAKKTDTKSCKLLKEMPKGSTLEKTIKLRDSKYPASPIFARNLYRDKNNKLIALGLRRIC